MDSNINNQLSLINYILKKYDKNSYFIKDVVNFIKNYNHVSFMIKDFEIDVENTEMVSYILSYLNDSMTDQSIYKLCLDTAIFVSNYTKILDKYSKNYIPKSKILINM